MPNATTTRPVTLLDGHANPPVNVDAVAIRDLSWPLLAEIELAWTPARRQFANTSEHSHWDWRNKIDFIKSGRNRLVAIECHGDIQGLMALLSQPQPSAYGADRQPLLYVDFLETAPWNLRGPEVRPRFIGVGTALIAEAVAISKEENCAGRVGLHSLPQAERFYELTCQMTRIGPDPNYYELVRFEYTE
jgi:hypothetical protein